jgi:glycine/D-amino acid oxidase-like deaminating enzyme
MSNKRSVAVIGCGVFGSMIAIKLAEIGMNVTVFEKQKDLLSGASYNNQNRLHLGFHYPRDIETAKQCIRGFKRFREEFEGCIFSNFKNTYFIASEGSLVTPEEYTSFCNNLDLDYELISLESFKPMVRGVDMGVECGEVVYDCHLLKKLVHEKLSKRKIKLKFESQVTNIERQGDGYSLTINNDKLNTFDEVINCTYADVNRLTQQLGFQSQELQYEYTMIPIIEWKHEPVGITIMDGKFMTVLPFGKSGKFLLYHVDYSVIERLVGKNMPEKWLNSKNTPLRSVDKKALFEIMRKKCSEFVPDLINARCVGFLEGPRAVLSKHDCDDARPSIISQHEPGYISVFTGKIDHCIWVADEVGKLLKKIETP